GSDKELSSWTFQPASSGAAPGDAEPAYVALALRPRLPRASGSGARRFAVVVDASRSMFGESYQRAVRLAARFVRELGEQDLVSVLACDVQCRRLPEGTAGRELAERARDFLSALSPEGASDPAAAVAAGLSLARDGGGPLHVVYIGDGTPTVGPVRPATIARSIEQASSGQAATVTTVAVGVDSDAQTLAALARGGGGTTLPYSPGQPTAEAAYALVSATYQSTLTDVRVELPEGLTEIAPARIDNIASGGERVIVARMQRDAIDGMAVVRGRVGGASFEQRYQLHLTRSSSSGNAFVPRLYAATRIADLEQRSDPEAKREAIELSSRFNVASRHTSLLVLESPAMFRAFGLDNTRRTPVWTGEEELEGELADGELYLEKEEAYAANPAQRSGAGAPSSAASALDW